MEFGLLTILALIVIGVYVYYESGANLTPEEKLLKLQRELIEFEEQEKYLGHASRNTYEKT